MKLENQLSQLQSIHPSDKLRKKLHGMVGMLPDQRRFYFSLPSFQLGVVLAILLVIVGVGSGVIAGVQDSRPGTMLYPVKELIQKKREHTNVLHQQVAPSVVPTGTVKKLMQASPTPQPTTTQPTPSLSPRVDGSHMSQGSPQENKRADFSEEAKSRVERFFKKFFDQNNNSSGKWHEK